MRWLTCILLLFLAAPALAQEARCTELDNDGDSGTHCGCSEPLNAGTGGDDVSDNGFTDPTDSSDATECSNLTSNPNPLGFGDEYSANHGAGDNGAPLYIISNGTVADLVPIGDVDAPLSGVAYVLEVAFGTSETNSGDLASLDYEFTDSTFCFRRYIHWNDVQWWNPLPGYQPGGDEDVKNGRWQDGHTGSTFQMQSVMYPEKTSVDPHPSGWLVHNTIDGNFGATSPSIELGRSWIVASNDPVAFETCQSTWCRQELCIDHNSRGGGDADKIVYRARVTALNGDPVQVYPSRLSTGTDTTVWTGQTSRLLEFALLDWTTPSPNPTGLKTYYSHAMVAFKTPSDETFWIGAASEIEGTGASLSGGALSGVKLQ